MNYEKIMLIILYILLIINIITVSTLIILDKNKQIEALKEELQKQTTAQRVNSINQIFEPIHLDKKYTKDNINITVIIKDRKEIEQICSNLTKTNAIGCATFNKDNNLCTIRVADIENQNDLITWGHELAHCEHGS